ncbi:MAG: hypothetical protein D6675_09095 [Gemmatimonadetes bacterium]|nr:MAG: hypothetical protein D6675_09095 [Gemmatimonadota bacterium]
MTNRNTLHIRIYTIHEAGFWAGILARLTSINYYFKAPLLKELNYLNRFSQIGFKPFNPPHYLLEVGVYPLRKIPVAQLELQTIYQFTDRRQEWEPFRTEVKTLFTYEALRREEPQLEKISEPKKNWNQLQTERFETENSQYIQAVRQAVRENVATFAKQFLAALPSSPLNL